MIEDCDKDCDKDCDDDIPKGEVLYRAFRQFIDYSKRLMPDGSQSFLGTYSTEDKLYLLNLMLSSNTTLKFGMQSIGQEPVSILCVQDGIYKLNISSDVDNPAQWTVFVNGIPDPGTTTGTGNGASECTLRTLLKLKKGTIVTYVNHISSFGNVGLSDNAGGLMVSNNCQFVLYKIAPYWCYDDDEDDDKRSS